MAQSEFVAVSDGGDTLCGLVDDGSVICNARTRVDNRTPAGLPPVTEVAAGLNSVCAVLSSGELTCWGSIAHGLLNHPTGQAPYRSVSISDSHACAINSTGAIDCWGFDRNDRLEAPEGDFVQLSLGVQQACAVDVNNRVACWGANDQGATDVPASLPDALKADASMGTSCALTTDREISCWGTPLAIPQGPFDDFQIEFQTICGLRSNGELSCAQTSFFGEGEVNEFSTPAGVRVSDYSVRGRRVCYVDDEGVIDCLGRSTQEIPVINGITPVPATTGLRADIYSLSAIELFWDAPRDAFNVAGHEIIRNGEVYAFTQNLSSFFIDDLVPGEAVTFSVQRVSVEDRRGAPSNSVSVNTDNNGAEGGSGGDVAAGDYQPPERPFEPTGLDAFVYGSTAIELVWDRVSSSQISGYEIRRDGEFIAFTNGVSFFEELAVGNKAFRYDVIPVNREDPSAFFGFSSITVGLGSASTGVCQ